MAGPVITLTTDFGTSDPYAGVMNGVILGINPEARIVELTHQVRPQAVHQGAFLIGKSHRYFPPGTIHLVVVDPGVGTARRAILLLTPTAAFVAPDNGVLTYVVPEENRQARAGLPEGYRAYSLTNPAFWRNPVSNTFHGRDIFAPVAAHLSLGVEPERLGESADSLTLLSLSRPRWQAGLLKGNVVHVDRYGNLVTDIEANILGEGNDIRIEVKGRVIDGLSRSYAEGGELMGIIGSFDTLEIAARNGSAASTLGADIGDGGRVTRLP